MSNNNTTNSASVTEFLKIVVVIAKIWVLTMIIIVLIIYIIGNSIGNSNGDIRCVMVIGLSWQ